VIPRVLNRRLSPLDASFLYIETPEAPMHIGGVEVFDGPLSRERLLARLADRIDAIPRYRQRVVPAPFGLGHPCWEDAPAFDLRDHVLETTLGPPGREDRLEACAARIIEPLLPRDRPLWELYLVQGLQGGRTAMVLKVHHAMVDGISGVELLDVLFDTAPNGHQAHEPTRVRAAAPSAGTARMLDVVWDAAAGTVEAGAGAIRAVAQWMGAAGARLAGSVNLAGTLARSAVQPVARLRFNRPLTGRRRLSWLTRPFAELRQIGGACGATLNDVVLAVITDGVGRFLRDAGDPTAGRHLRLLVPVNVRREDESGRLGNRVSMLPVEVPFDAEPLDRLRLVRERTRDLKQTGLADAVEDLMAIGGLLPAPLYAGALALAAHPTALAWSAPLRSLPPLTANVVCTNVPGPPSPLYAQGRRLVAHYPLVPLAFELGLSFAVFSYDQRLFFGLIADAAAIDDLGPLARHIEGALEELRVAAGVPAIPPLPITRFD
jgi:diacylglycerol O-acyltransferase